MTGYHQPIGQVLINAETGQMGTGTNMDGKATYQELALLFGSNGVNGGQVLVLSQLDLD
jgi:hypothetical protein